MQPSTVEWKQQLRRQCRETRALLGQTVREQASQIICTHIESWKPFQNSNVIQTYLPMRGEVDLLPLLERHPDKHWLVPRIIPEQNHRMAFHMYHPEFLVRHKFGMLEPAENTPEVPPEEVELALVPGLAYDLQGWRLGYGGGYFDRFLNNFKGASLGILYQALLLDTLPHSAHDAPVKWIVTETGIIEVAASAG